MKKTIFFHIGSHKTGTTAIQRFLSANRALLAENGFLYPGKVEGHHDMAEELADLPLGQLTGNPQSATRSCFDEIDQSDLQTVIISSEAFEVLGPGMVNLKELLAGRFTVKIIFYVRRQDEKIEAIYNASVKNPRWRSTARFVDFLAGTAESLPPGQHSLAECIAEFGELDYLAVLRPWQETFGRENIIVRCYEREQLPGGIFQDFFTAVGIRPDPRYVIPEGRINPSLHWDLIEVIRQTNIRYKDDPVFHRFLLNHLTRINHTYQGGRKPHLFSPRERREIIARYAESNACIAREYLGRDDGQLFRAPVPEGDAPWDPTLSEERMTGIFLEMLHVMSDLRRKAS